MRFSDLLAGTAPRETVEVEIGGKPAKIDLRLLSLTEETQTIVQAREYAKDKGGLTDQPSEADALYEIGLHRATVAMCCMDTENAEKTFFEPDDLDHPTVSRELVAYLYARYCFLADKSSPRKLDISEPEWAALVVSSASVSSGGNDDPLPFCRLRPGAQWSCFRSLASLLLGSPEGRSLYSNALRAKSLSSSNSSAPS